MSNFSKIKFKMNYKCHRGQIEEFLENVIFHKSQNTSDHKSFLVAHDLKLSFQEVISNEIVLSTRVNEPKKAVEPVVNPRQFVSKKIDSSLNSSLNTVDGKLNNTEVIKSEFNGAGEILPYYYFLKYKWADRMIFLHDSMFLNRPFRDSELEGNMQRVVNNYECVYVNTFSAELYI